MLRFRGLDVEAYPPRNRVQPREGFFELARRGQVVNLTAPGRHQEEDTPQGNLELLEQVGESFDLVEVTPRDAGVDLDLLADFVGPANRLQRVLVRAHDAAEGVVDFGGGA